jgi:gliding motility-associated-like protein
MKKYLPILLLTFFHCFVQGQNVKIIESEGNYSMDTSWLNVASGMGYNATIVPLTTLNDTSFFGSTDILIVTSGIMAYSQVQQDNIKAFLQSGKPVYLQTEYQSAYVSNQLFAQIVNSMGGSFSWGPELSGNLASSTIIEGTFSSTDNIVTTLPYVWYARQGVSGQNVFPFMKSGSNEIGWSFCPSNSSYGKLITTTDQDWIQQGSNYGVNTISLLKNILKHLQIPSLCGPECNVAVTTTGNSTCKNTSATLVASGADGYNWYDAATAGNLLATTSTYTTPVLTTNTTYYVEGIKGILATPLETTFAGNNNHNGNMFDVTSTNNVTITGFDINPNSTGTYPMYVYYRVGGHTGFENNAAAWTLLGTTTLNVTAGLPILLPLGGLDMTAGQTYGIYITATGGNYLNYTNGSSTYTDGTLTITTGTGQGYPFGPKIDSRIWNGRIHYAAINCTGPRAAVLVTVKPTATLTATFTNASCTTVADGTATIVATAGVTPYTYSWDTTPVQTTNTATGLLPGTYTVTVTDNNTCVTKESITIAVADTVLPNVITQNITIPLDATGNAIITAAQINNGSTDNCGIDTMVLDITAFDCTKLGDNIVTLTVTDVNGNIATGTATVTITDTILPIAATQNITVQLDTTGTVVITPAQVDNGSADNCMFTLSLDKDSFDCTNIGANNVTLTVTDSSNNIHTATAIVTVEDSIDPAAVTQNITIPLDAAGNAVITTAQIDNGSSDNCTFTLSLDKDSFNCSNLGVNTVILTATDASGNIGTATATVTIEDTINPIAIAQNIIVPLDAAGNAVITPAQINNGSTDNCVIGTMALDITSFDCTNVGVNTVILTITDTSGNIDTASAIVTVEDSMLPTVLTQNITVQLDATGNAVITPSQINNGSTDNCGIDTMVLDVTAFNCANVGTNTVTLTVTDVNGNTATGTATVTVEDVMVPTVITQNITVQLDATGNVVIIPAQINNGSTDNCAIDTMVLDVTAFNCTNIGVNTVTLTVTDVNGNSATGTATVTVEDTIIPTVITQDIVVQLDAAGTAVITPAQINNGSTDNCGIDTIVLDVTAFDCTDLGANTVILTVTDVNGNSANATAVVTVQDTILPVAIAQNITVNLDAVTGLITIIPAQIDNGSSDNCTFQLSLNVTDFDCNDIGANPVQLSVTDVAGNITTANAVVTVLDSTAPTVITQPFTIPLNPNGEILLVPAQVDGGSFDNCGIVTRSVTPNLFSCSDLGDHTVTLTVADNSGNSSSATAIVTVIDNIKPVVITQNITVPLGQNGTVTVTPQQVDNGSTDKCGIDSMSLDISTFDCTDIGAHNVVLTVTDVGGNSATANAVVTIVDTTGPVIASPPLTLFLDANGQAVLTVADVSNGITDNCGIQSIVLNKTAFTCVDLGTNKVTVVATDVNNNITQQQIAITIADVIVPVAIAQDITVALDTDGFVVITPDMINNGSTDNCAIDSMTLDITSFTCTNIGPNTVILTVKDKAGNTDTVTAIVTVLPVPVPVFTNLNQVFCAIDEPIIDDIAVNSDHVVWYSDATTTKELSPSTILASGTYYAATRYKACYSTRVAITVTINDSPAPTGESVQYVCLEEKFTIASLATDQEEVVWYDTPTGGNPLSASTELENKKMYYASYVGKECESTKRFAVELIVRHCDVVIHNAVSANGDGRNDYFSIEGAETFTDNKLEIFNRWGAVVFETTRYGQNGNLFKGNANTGLASSGGLLPFGTYYYVFSFTNHDGNRITKTGYLHLNN